MIEKPSLSTVSPSLLLELSRCTGTDINRLEDMLVFLWEMGEEQENGDHCLKSQFYLPQTRSIVVYDDIIERMQTMEHLDVYHRLAIALPTEMAFRAAEVGTFCYEHMFPERRECLVFDSKKHQLFMVNMTKHVEDLAEEIGRHSGPVLLPRTGPAKAKMQPMGPENVWILWKDVTDPMGLPSCVTVNPRSGRQYFILDYLRRHFDDLRHMPYNPFVLAPLCAQTRHSSEQRLYDYAKGLMGWTDVKRSFQQYEEAHLRHLAGLPKSIHKEKPLEMQQE